MMSTLLAYLVEHFADLREQARRFVLQHRLSADLAEDIAQETCLQALKSQVRFDLTRPVSGWLYGIMRNVTLQQREAQRHLHRQHLPWAPPDPEKQATDRQEAKQVLAPLSTADQEVLALAHALELTSEELGERLGVSPGAARVRLCRAGQRLRAAKGDPS